MDAKFIDRELAAWERLHRLAESRGIELPPELAVTLGEESLAWTEADCIAYLEREYARRSAGLARVTTPRTELLPYRGPERISGADRVRGSTPRNVDIKGQVDLTGQPVSLANIRAEARADHEARREANRARQAKHDATATQRRIEAAMRRYTR